jgi:multiple sugar transport system ATP-binding protein
MLAGLEEISDGQILIGDRVVNDVPPKDRDIAMVFQSYALYPHMSVYDNMAFGLKLRKMPKDEIDRRVKEAAEIAGHRRPPGPQAQGALRRPAPARGRGPRHRAQPQGLPLRRAALQPGRQAARADARRDQQAVQRLGTTFIYVTHDQVEAMTMGDRIAVMKDGMMQQVDTPAHLYDHPAQPSSWPASSAARR